MTGDVKSSVYAEYLSRCEQKPHGADLAHGRYCAPCLAKRGRFELERSRCQHLWEVHCDCQWCSKCGTTSALPEPRR